MLYFLSELLGLELQVLVYGKYIIFVMQMLSVFIICRSFSVCVVRCC